MTKLLTSLLIFLGRYASYTLPAGVFLGLFIPQLAAYLKPFLLPALLVPLTLSLVRIQTSELIQSFKNWRILIILSLWALIVCPVLVWIALLPFNLPEPIYMASVIFAAAPPVTAAAAVAVFLRINAAIAVAMTVVTMLLVPLTLPLILKYLIHLEVSVELWELSLHLSGFIFTTFVLAIIIKKWLGETRIKQSAKIIDGLSVVFISIFTIGIMNGVADLFLQKPKFVLQTLFVSTLLVLALYLISSLVFWRLGASKAMAIGLSCGNCNLGLMYLVLANQAPLELLIFFGIGQIPLYSLPTLLAPLVDKLNKRVGC